MTAQANLDLDLNKRNLANHSLSFYFDDKLFWSTSFWDAFVPRNFGTRVLRKLHLQFLYFWTHPTKYFRKNSAAINSQVIWPQQLQRYLEGQGKLKIVDNDANNHLGMVLFDDEVSFGSSKKSLKVVDSLGDYMYLTKWGAFGHNFQDNPQNRQLIIAEAKKLSDLCWKNGYNVFLCSGSLLGALRNGKLLGHDDDVDFGLFFEVDDINLLIERTQQFADFLKKNDYPVIMHSKAHVQIPYYDKDFNVKFYIDFFLAFFKDGYYNQPIVLRTTKIQPADILPKSEIVLEKQTFNTYHQPEVWLKSLYGPNFLEPDPGFVLPMQKSTKRLFDDWFGKGQVPTLNFWQNYASDPEFSAPIDGNEVHLKHLKDNFDKNLPILDLGSGNGLFSKELIDLGYQVISVDFSPKSNLVAQQNGVKTLQLNLQNDQDFGELIKTLPQKFNITISNSFHEFNSEARLKIFELIQVANLSLISFDADPSPKIFNRFNPLTWSYSKRELFSESKNFILNPTLLQKYQRRAFNYFSEPTVRQSELWLIQAG